MNSFPKLLFGTGVSSAKDIYTMEQVINSALEGGIVGFDTAPSYKSEVLLSAVLHKIFSKKEIMREDVFIQTKIDAWQMVEGKDNVKKHAKSALCAMTLEYFDSLLVHWPIPDNLEDTWQALIELKEEGIVKHIGICNVRERQLNILLRQEYIPEIVQIERNPLLNLNKEVELCLKNGVAVQAYSPLCKMHPLIANSKCLEDLAMKHSKSIGQIVLRWQLDTGVAPIFTSKNPSRVKEYSELSDFSLSKEEITKINKLNINYKMYLESWACPGF